MSSSFVGGPASKDFVRDLIALAHAGNVSKLMYSKEDLHISLEFRPGMGYDLIESEPTTPETVADPDRVSDDDLDLAYHSS